MNDLEAIRDSIEQLKSITQTLVSRVETRIPLVDGFDDRLARAEHLEKSLASTALKMAAVRALTSWVPGALAGAAAGAVVVWIFLSSGVAGAH